MFRIGLVVVFLGGGLTGLTEAQTPHAESVKIERVEIGIGGHFKIGSWAPVNVTVNTSGPVRLQLLVEADDPDRNRVTLPSPWTDVPAEGTHQLTGLFKCGRKDAEISVAVQSESEVLAERRVRLGEEPEADGRPPLEQSVLLVATLGQPAGLDDFSKPAARIVHLETADQLPLEAMGYDALNALVVADHYELGERQSRAVREWVGWGGHLILAVGSEVEEYQDSSLAEWVSHGADGGTVPAVPVTGQLDLRELSGMESFAGAGRPIRLPRRVPAARLGDVRGEVLVPGLDGPLLVRAPFGFGHVTFLALDLNRPPLSDWESVGDLMRKLIAPGNGPKTPDESPRRGRLTHSGITDLASQLNAAQDHFPRVHRYSTWMVMGLLLVYLALIGPADYFVVHRLLKKPQLTWFTFPAMVIAAVGVTAWWAAAANGDQLRLNQIDVIDIDERTGLLRVHSWITLYSPQTGRYHVELKPQTAQWTDDAGVARPESSKGVASLRPRPSLRSGRATSGPWLMWAGIPEETLGGMYRSGGFQIGRSGYQFRSRPSGIPDLPLSIWSTKSLTGCWRGQAHELVESSLQSTGTGQLTGRLTHRLPVPIEDWMLAYANRVYRTSAGGALLRDDRLMPNQTLSPQDPTVGARALSGFLTGMRRTRVETSRGADDEIQIQKTLYDPLNRDEFEILRMITFHQAAGGTEYTGLTNHPLRKHDLTGLLRSGRAVLFGRVDLPATRLLINGAEIEPERHTAVVRIVLPVRPAGTVLRALPKPDQ